MVPRAEFRSYYGRPILKPPAWEEDIAYYFFLGGLSAGSALLGAGADLTGRPAYEFSLPDTSDRIHRLAAFRGSWLLMMFHRHLG